MAYPALVESKASVEVGPRNQPDERLIAASTPMREILRLAERVARTNVSVLIQGEIGTGKQTLARHIHRLSPRAEGPLVHVVCGSLRETDLEEKLFGSSWESPTGSGDAPSSLFEASRQGTLFLDGVTHLPLWAQAKLLDALQHGNCSGGRGDADPARPRVIASSTCDLQAAVAENRFFSGLYYFLNAVCFDIPPLRQRREDVRALAEHFLAAAMPPATAFGKPLRRRFSVEAWEALAEYDWPGNILQLAATVAHAAMVADGPEIGRACFHGLLDQARRPAGAETIAVPLTGGLKDMELALINEVIRRCRGNKAAAARALRLHRRTLYRMLEG
jgi:DNA-binding NtrC family response regulator